VIKNCVALRFLQIARDILKCNQAADFTLILQDLGKCYSTVNVVLLFKNCLTDCLPQIRIIFVNYVRKHFRQAITINTVEVCAKITCVCM